MFQRTTNQHPPASPSNRDYTVRLWALESCEMTLSAESAADALALGRSRWLDEAIEFVDDGYWSVEELPAA